MDRTAAALALLATLTARWSAAVADGTVDPAVGARWLAKLAADRAALLD